jgi:hypothetical protein
VPGRHDRRAALASGGYARPASLDETGLLVTVYGESSGVEGVFDFTRLAGSLELRRAMAAAFDRKSGPGGTWRAWATCDGAFKHVCGFLTWLAGRGRPAADRRGYHPGRLDVVAHVGTGHLRRPFLPHGDPDPNA